MHPFIEVRFQRRPHVPSIESAIHRWVARLEAMGFDVRGATVTVGASLRRQTAVALSLVSAGRTATVTASHDDPYVAVSDAFRAVRRNLLAAGTLAPPLQPTGS